MIETKAWRTSIKLNARVDSLKSIPSILIKRSFYLRWGLQKLVCIGSGI